MTTDESSSLSKSRLARLQDILERHVAENSVPGLVSVISGKGEVHLDAIGHSALGGDRRVVEDTIFRISSMTKQITGVAE